MTTIRPLKNSNGAGIVALTPPASPNNEATVQASISAVPAESLDELTAKFNMERAGADESTRRGLIHAITAGGLLLEIKQQLKKQKGHGHWKTWMKENNAPERSTQRYIKLWKAFGGKSDTVSDMSFNEAIKLLGKTTGGEAYRESQLSRGSDQRYTCKAEIALVRQVLGGIDLDPCSDPEMTVPAKDHYREGGLEKPWVGRIYANPPYGAGLGKWVDKARSEFESGAAKEIILMLPCHSETPYFHRLAEYDRCEIEGKVKFVHGDGEHKGKALPIPWGSVVFYLGPNRAKFYSVFAHRGAVLRSLRSEEEAAREVVPRKPMAKAATLDGRGAAGSGDACEAVAA